MTKSSPQNTACPSLVSRFDTALYVVLVGVLVAVPLLMDTTVYHITVLPKFLALLFGSATTLLLLAMVVSFDPHGLERLYLLKSKIVVLVLAYVLIIGLSTMFGVARLASLFGSLDSQMGWFSYLCFFVCFVGLIVAIGTSEQRLVPTLWAIAITGLLVSAYAFMQFAGRDPFLPARSYTFRSPDGSLLRVASSLGHSDYLGNFLLYTTPISAALAMMSSGRARRFTIMGVVLSLAAIVFSGTRGAWVGIVVSTAVFVWLGWRKQGALAISRRQLMVALAAVLAVGVIVIILIGPRLSGISKRVFAADATGSGRTLLWHDAVKMVPAYALTGCGPEGFSKAFLAYKSPQLARIAPQINNESSHNDYLDAFISFGLVGGLLHMVIIILTFLLLVHWRRQAATQQRRWLCNGLIAALAGVCVHNFFIFNQLPTGLYFFSFIALSLAAANVIAAQPAPEDQIQTTNTPLSVIASVKAVPVYAKGLMLACSATALIISSWYIVGLYRADTAIKHSFESAAILEYDHVVDYGQVAVGHGNATGAYDYLFARALANYVDGIARRHSDQADVKVELPRPAIDLAMAHAEIGLQHSLTPEANCVLLAYLALKAGDQDKLRAYAQQALAWDHNLFSAHWLMGESLLADGQKDAAIAEAQAALALHSGSIEPRSVLARARGDKLTGDPLIQSLIQKADHLDRQSDLRKARKVLGRAIRQTETPCPACHRALAIICEKMSLYDEAIDEWKTFLTLSPDQAANQQVPQHIQSLHEKATGQQ